MNNDWAHSYRTVANSMKSTADTSGGEAFNPYLKGGVSGAKFNALTGTADYTGNVLGTYANAMQSHQDEVNRAAVAEKNRQNQQMKSDAIDQLKQQTDLISKSDDLKTQMAVSLFGAKDSGGNQLNKDTVNSAINVSLQIDNAIQAGHSLDDVYKMLGGVSNPEVYQYLANYTTKSYNLFNPGNTFQETQPPPPPEPSVWNKLGSYLGNEATAGYNKIKSYL